MQEFGVCFPQAEDRPQTGESELALSRLHPCGLNMVHCAILLRPKRRRLHSIPDACIWLLPLPSGMSSWHSMPVRVGDERDLSYPHEWHAMLNEEMSAFVQCDIKIKPSVPAREP